MPKLYDLKREGLFELLSEFPEIQLANAGPIWVTAWINEDFAKKILDKRPNSLTLSNCNSK